MDTYSLGSQPVDRVAFGAMQLPGPGVFGPPRDHDQAIAVLKRVIELGINHIDTAQFYGPNVANELIREALHPFDAQLSAMIQARDEGLIAGIGLSSVSVDHLRIAVERTQIACVQNLYNLVDRTSQPVLDLCLEHGIAFVPFFPLGSGFTPDNPVLNHPAVVSEARKLGRTPAQIALAWTLSVAPNVLLIPGTSSSRTSTRTPPSVTSRSTTTRSGNSTPPRVSATAVRRVFRWGTTTSPAPLTRGRQRKCERASALVE